MEIVDPRVDNKRGNMQLPSRFQIGDVVRVTSDAAMVSLGSGHVTLVSFSESKVYYDVSIDGVVLNRLDSCDVNL